MSDVKANVRQQTELYGAPLGEVVGAICSALTVNQATVARVLGLSPPMLSHLVGARRVKVSNPIAHARLIQLRQLAEDVATGRVDQATAASELDAIAASQDSWTTTRAPTDPAARATTQPDVDPRHGVQSELLSAASAAEWRLIADQIDRDYPRAAELLRAWAGAD